MKFTPKQNKQEGNIYQQKKPSSKTGHIQVTDLLRTRIIQRYIYRDHYFLMKHDKFTDPIRKYFHRNGMHREIDRIQFE